MKISLDTVLLLSPLVLFAAIIIDTYVQREKRRILKGKTMSRLDDIHRQIGQLEYERRVLEDERERRLEAIYGVTRCSYCEMFPKVRYYGGFKYYECGCDHR